MYRLLHIHKCTCYIVRCQNVGRNVYQKILKKETSAIEVQWGTRQLVNKLRDTIETEISDNLDSQVEMSEKHFEITES